MNLFKTMGLAAIAVLFSQAAAFAAVDTNQIADGAVTTSKIADGAVTDQKITGPIAAAKISSNGLNADMVDGLHSADIARAVHEHPQSDVNGLDAALAGKANATHDHDAVYQKKYGSVAVVAQTGGDYTSLEVALGDSANWCSVAPCLVKVMPGTYTSSSNGQSGIAIHKYMTIEGSGEGSTNIICGSMTLYNDGEVRSLTITSPLPINAYYTPVAPPYANSTGPAIVRNVTLNTTSNDGTGVVNYNANLELSNVKINVIGPGGGTGTAVNSMYNFTKLNNVTMSVPSAGTAILSNYNSNVYVANSSIIAPPTAMAFTFGSYPGAIYANNSQINGQITPGVGTVKCVGAFNANYDPITCP